MRDISRFTKNFELAKRGNPNAQYSLSFCYRNGERVEQDYKEAIKWLNKAAGQEFSDAQYKLGDSYYYG